VKTFIPLRPQAARFAHAPESSRRDARHEERAHLFSQSKKGRKENSIHLYNILDYADNSDIPPEAQGALLLAQTADKMGGAGE
jgi:hypothetical protein